VAARRGEDDIPQVVCALDNNYAMALSAMLRSLAANLHRGQRTDVYILSSDLTSYNKDKLRQSVATSHVRLEFIAVNASRVANLKLTRHVTHVTYYRILIPEILPHLSRAIYLDCDIVLRKNIGELWSAPIRDHHVLAVPEMWKPASTADSRFGLRTYREMKIPSGSPIFNAGVMVMALDLWRRDDVCTKVLDYLDRFRRKVLWWDQDGLNAVLAGAWSPLDPRWNVTTKIFRIYKSSPKSPFKQSLYDLLLNDPFIIHYNSKFKPWLPGYNAPFKNDFMQYVDASLYQAAQLDSSDDS
jgi:lipopolysaccharide biosynthesis glycosyltransferase